MSIKITNDYGKDLVFKTHPKGQDTLPEEITIKDGETYDVPAEQATDFLKWYMNAVLASDSSNDGSDDEETGAATEEEAKTATVTNDREFDIEIKYVENDEEKVVVVKAGESVEVPEDLAEDIKKQITDAEAPETKADTDTTTTTAEEKKSDENKALEEGKADLARREAAFAEKEAKARFRELLQEGKVTPAQETSYMALATKANGATVLSEGKSISVEAALAEFLQNAPKQSLLNEEGKGGNADPTEEEVELTEEEKALGEVFDNSEDDLKKIKKEEGE